MGRRAQLSGPQLHARRDARRRQGALLRLECRAVRRDRPGRGEQGGGAGAEGPDVGAGRDQVRQKVPAHGLGRDAEGDEGAGKHDGDEKGDAALDPAGDEGGVRHRGEAGWVVARCLLPVARGQQTGNWQPATGNGQPCTKSSKPTSPRSPSTPSSTPRTPRSWAAAAWTAPSTAPPVPSCS